MKALTLWQPWANLVVRGCKPYEFRHWQAPRSLVGQRIVIHAAKRPIDCEEIRALLDDPVRLRGSVGNSRDQLAAAQNHLEALRAGPGAAPRGAGLGTARLGKPGLATDLLFGHADPDTIDPDIWAWPMEEVERWEVPVPALGAQGFWHWRPAGGDDLFESAA